MKSKRFIALMWVLALLPLAAVAVSWPFLPQRVPTNWGFDGRVTYGSRSTLWVIAGLSPLLALMFQFLPRVDPKKESYRKFQGFYDSFAVGMSLFLLLMVAIILTEAFRPGTVNVGRVVMLVLALLFLFLGAFMGKVKTNWFMGFRTPWALSDPDVWNRTHRLGGWVFFLVGLGTVPLALFAPERVMAGVFLAALLLGVLLVYVMSWKWYRDKTTSRED